jgi:SOS response regulatory protein OraA/RecX
VSEIYHEALRLLRRRDYTEKQLRDRLVARFGEVPQEVFDRLGASRFLNDRRVAENIVAKRFEHHPDSIREELRTAGVEAGIIEDVMSKISRRSLREVVDAKMADWRLGIPLQPKEASRLFRALRKLGFPEDEIREELETLI